MSGKDIPAVQLAVLNKGLAYVPTIQHDSFQLRIDIEQMIRKLHLQLYFSQQLSTAESPSDVDRVPLPLQSSWSPPTPPPAALLLYRDLILQDLKRVESTQSRSRHTLTTLERLALRDLRSRSDLVIQRADKGGVGL